MIGFIFVMFGVSQIATASEVTPNLPLYMTFAAPFSLVEGLTFWGILFIVTGAIGMLSAFRGHYYIGFVTLMFMSTWWGLLYAASYWMTHYDRIVPAIFVWLLISYFLYTLSSWKEATEDHEE